MQFNTHSRLVGQHAYLSASKPSWTNYDEDKMVRAFGLAQAVARGNDLHAVAAELIRLGVKTTRSNKTFNSYVNDCIGFRMKSEQLLYYSDNCFGTADAIGFTGKILRISDLKTGVSPASVKQLEVYAALFCLEYRMNPFDIEIELRIYQSDEVKLFIADGDDIHKIMSKIRAFDILITNMRLEELS